MGVTTLWMNEQKFAEAAYGGLYAGSFADGYHATVPIAHYLLADFTTLLAPNDPTRERP